MTNSGSIFAAVRMLGVLGLLAVGGACQSDEEPGAPPAATVTGTVRTGSGLPVPAASVLLRVWDSNDALQGSVTAVTDRTGRFSSSFALDSVLADGYLLIDVEPELGSGISRGYGGGALAFDPAGRTEFTSAAITVEQLAPPAPEGPPVAMNPATVIGGYAGRTIPPETMQGGVYLELSLTSVVGDSVHGRYDIGFDATATCGDGLGTVDGAIEGDTLRLRFTSDPWAGGSGLVTHFLALTYSTAADTLILRYPPEAGDCNVGEPAPLRLVRQ